MYPLVIRPHCHSDFSDGRSWDRGLESTFAVALGFRGLEERNVEGAVESAWRCGVCLGEVQRGLQKSPRKSGNLRL